MVKHYAKYDITQLQTHFIIFNQTRAGHATKSRLMLSCYIERQRLVW